jgi:hypothetical protein
MEKAGIVYLMKTVIKGVYKIGISDVSNFEGRMRHLENNGYANVAGLERILAIKTDNYKEKETLLHEIFGKSQIGETELFAIDENLVKRLFLSLRGEIVFPKNETAELGFEKTVKEHHQEKIFEVNRSAFISFIKEKHQQNPSILRNLISSENAYKPKNSKVRLHKDKYFGKSGSKLTTEIEEGLHIYTTYSKKDLKIAYEDYSKLFESQ